VVVNVTNAQHHLMKLGVETDHVWWDERCGRVALLEKPRKIVRQRE
jgi:hypothetical protein